MVQRNIPLEIHPIRATLPGARTRTCARARPRIACELDMDRT